MLQLPTEEKSGSLMCAHTDMDSDNPVFSAYGGTFAARSTYTFYEREKLRRIRLTGTILMMLELLIVLVGVFQGLLPAVERNQSGRLVGSIGLMVIIGFATFLNWRGRIEWAGGIAVVACVVGLALDLTVVQPALGPQDLPRFDLFVVVELLAASLLQTRWVFLVAVGNSLLILCILMLYPHDGALARLFLEQGIYPIASSPIFLQASVALVLYFGWISANQAVLQAGRLKHERDMARLNYRHVLQTLEDVRDEARTEVLDEVKQAIASIEITMQQQARGTNDGSPVGCEPTGTFLDETFLPTLNELLKSRCSERSEFQDHS